MPAPLPKGLFLFMPFKPDVWAYVVCTFLITLLFFKIVEKFIRKFLKPVLIWSHDWYQPPKVRREELTWIHIFAPLSKAPVSDKPIPRRPAYRILLGYWFIFAFLVTIFFSTQMVGFLLSIPHETRIASLSDLVERNDDP
jgi:hypothetical protein